MNGSLHESFMREAIQEAIKALEIGEVPIGAVLTLNDRIIGRGHNLRESLKDPTAHAELLAIREASLKLGDWRLEGTTMYVTVEPCPMCAGAIVLARVERLVYGARDPKMGSAGSLFNLVEDKRLNHRVELTTGVLAEECRRLVSDFFCKLRAARRDVGAVERAGLENRWASYSPRGFESHSLRHKKDS